MSKVGENRVPTCTAPEKSECEGNNAPLSQPTGHTEGGGPKVPTNIAPNDVADKLLRDARHTKRELLGKIFEISRELSGFSISDDVSELRDKIGMLEREVDQFFDLISKKELQFSELGQQISKKFGYLKNKIEELEEQPILPCDSVSAVSETSNASSCALAQIDLDLKKKELECEAKQRHAQLALELGLKEARLDAEQRKLDVLNRSRSASRCNSKVGSRVSSSLGSHGSFLGSHKGLSSLLEKAEKSNFTFQSKVVAETDHGAAVFSSSPAHRDEPPVVDRGAAAGSFFRAEKQDTTERQKSSLPPRSGFKHTVDFDELSGPSKVAPAPESAPHTRGVLPPPGFEKHARGVLPPPVFDKHARGVLPPPVFDSKPLRLEESFSKRKPCSEGDVVQKTLVVPGKDKVNDPGYVISSDKMNYTEQQENFFQYQNSKTFLDKAALIKYEGKTPFIFFKNRVEALMASCPFEGMRLTILESSCINLALQVIMNIVADSPGVSEEDRIKMCLDRLEQKFGIRGGFLAEPEVRKIRYGSKLSSGSANLLREFKSEISTCLIYAKAYRKTDKLEGRFVLDLAKRLPTEVKQRYLDFLLMKFESTNEPSFQSLIDFISREETLKGTDFGFMLLGDIVETKKLPDRDKTPSFKVRQVDAKSSASHNAPTPEKGSVTSRLETKNGPHDHCPDSVKKFEDKPSCLYCSLQGRSERHFLSKCNAFSRLNADARKGAVVKSGRCLNCLGLHLVRQCPRPNNCRKCSPDFDKKHYYLLHDAFILKPAAKNENSVVASRNLRIEKVKAAYNRVTAARIFNPATGKQKLVYCQHDPGSQLTFVSSTLVQDLGIVPFDRTSFKLDTLIGAKDSFADVITFALQSLDTNEMFCDITAVVHEPWSDDAEGLPHRQLLNELKHFEDVDVFTIDGCDVVDVIIGNDNAFLMTVIEEKRGESRDEPHAIYTPLGWLASGGRAVLSSSVANSKRVCSAVMENDLPFSYSGELEKRDREILHLKDKLKSLNPHVMMSWLGT